MFDFGTLTSVVAYDILLTSLILISFVTILSTYLLLIKKELSID